ncbi:hypothetical protein PLESTM_001356100 [Pleodorina starrii]|nr:hypothetical protein PLESTM_001356100 [Pleodorina starrii]
MGAELHRLRPARQVPWKLYEFPEFPWPKDLQPSSEYPTGQEVQEYVREYVRQYDLRRHVRFNCKLLRLRWVAASRQWDALYCDTLQEKFFKVTVDYAVICAGIYSQPYIPDYEGTDSYAGIQLHAKDFVDLSLARGRRVVIVGAGKTALDCVSSIVATNTATSVTLLYRQAHWPLPRRMLGTSVRRLLFNRAMTTMMPPYYTASGTASATSKVTAPLRKLFWRGMESVISRKFHITEHMRPRVHLPADLFYGGQILDNTMDKLVRSEALLTVKGEINRFVRNGVILQDGNFVAADLVLYCTGYLKTYDYLEGDMRSRLELQKDGLYLYRNCLPYAVPHLAFIGSEVSTYNNILTHGLQALWLAHILSGRTPLPPPSAMADDVRAQQRWRRSIMPAQRSRGSVLMLYMMQYHDQLLADMGFPSRRKGFNLLAECFGTYTATDYHQLVEGDDAALLAAARSAEEQLAAAGEPPAVLAAEAAGRAGVGPPGSAAGAAAPEAAAPPPPPGGGGAGGASGAPGALRAPAANDDSRYFCNSSRGGTSASARSFNGGEGCCCHLQQQQQQGQDDLGCCGCGAGVAAGPGAAAAAAAAAAAGRVGSPGSSSVGVASADSPQRGRPPACRDATSAAAAAVTFAASSAPDGVGSAPLWARTEQQRRSARALSMRVASDLSNAARGMNGGGPSGTGAGAADGRRPATASAAPATNALRRRAAAGGPESSDSDHRTAAPQLAFFPADGWSASTALPAPVRGCAGTNMFASAPIRQTAAATDRSSAAAAAAGRRSFTSRGPWDPTGGTAAAATAAAAAGPSASGGYAGPSSSRLSRHTGPTSPIPCQSKHTAGVPLQQQQQQQRSLADTWPYGSQYSVPNGLSYHHPQQQQQHQHQQQQQQQHVRWSMLSSGDVAEVAPSGGSASGMFVRQYGSGLHGGLRSLPENASPYGTASAIAGGSGGDGSGSLLCECSSAGAGTAAGGSGSGGAAVCGHCSGSGGDWLPPSDNLPYRSHQNHLRPATAPQAGSREAPPPPPPSEETDRGAEQRGGSGGGSGDGYEAHCGLQQTGGARAAEGGGGGQVCGDGAASGARPGSGSAADGEAAGHQPGAGAAAAAAARSGGGGGSPPAVAPPASRCNDTTCSSSNHHNHHNHHNHNHHNNSNNQLHAATSCVPPASSSDRSHRLSSCSHSQSIADSAPSSNNSSGPNTVETAAGGGLEDPGGAVDKIYPIVEDEGSAVVLADCRPPPSPPLPLPQPAAAAAAPPAWYAFASDATRLATYGSLGGASDGGGGGGGLFGSPGSSAVSLSLWNASSATSATIGRMMHGGTGRGSMVLSESRLGAMGTLLEVEQADSVDDGGGGGEAAAASAAAGAGERGSSNPAAPPARAVPTAAAPAILALTRAGSGGAGRSPRRGSAVSGGSALFMVNGAGGGGGSSRDWRRVGSLGRSTDGVTAGLAEGAAGAAGSGGVGAGSVSSWNMFPGASSNGAYSTGSSGGQIYSSISFAADLRNGGGGGSSSSAAAAAGGAQLPPELLVRQPSRLSSCPTADSIIANMMDASGGNEAAAAVDEGGGAAAATASDAGGGGGLGPLAVGSCSSTIPFVPLADTSPFRSPTE